MHNTECHRIFPPQTSVMACINLHSLKEKAEDCCLPKSYIWCLKYHVKPGTNLKHSGWQAAGGHSMLLSEHMKKKKGWTLAGTHICTFPLPHKYTPSRRRKDWSLDECRVFLQVSKLQPHRSNLAHSLHLEIKFRWTPPPSFMDGLWLFTCYTSRVESLSLNHKDHKVYKAKNILHPTL